MRTLRELVDKILINLGISSINVEITPTDIIQAIHDAIEVYNKYIPGMSWDVLNVSENIRRYVIDKRNITGVLEVQFLREFRLMTGVDIIPDFVGRLAEVEQWFMGREDAARILSTKPNWTSAWEAPLNNTGAPKKRELVLYIYVPTIVPYKCSYLYSWKREASDDLQYGIPSIPDNHGEWVEDYALASAKVILGRILDKFKGVASPANTGLDGADLRSEGASEKAQLLSDILSWREQPPPIVA